MAQPSATALGDGTAGSSMSLKCAMLRHGAVSSSCGVFPVLPCPPADASVEPLLQQGNLGGMTAPTGPDTSPPLGKGSTWVPWGKERRTGESGEGKRGPGTAQEPSCSCGEARLQAQPHAGAHRPHGGTGGGQPLRSPLHTPGCALLSPHFPEFKQKPLPTHPGRPWGAEPGAAGRRGAGTSSGPSPPRPEPPPPPRPPHCAAPPLLPPPAPPGLTYSPTRIYSPSVCCEK